MSEKLASCRATAAPCERYATEGLNWCRSWVQCDALVSERKAKGNQMANKLKTHKGARKRFKVTATGKVRYKRSFAGHLMSGKSGDRCRKMHKASFLAPADASKVRPFIEN